MNLSCSPPIPEREVGCEYIVLSHPVSRDSERAIPRYEIAAVYLHLGVNANVNRTEPDVTATYCFPSTA